MSLANFAPPPPLFDDDDDKGIHPATAGIGEQSKAPNQMTKTESRMDHCRKVLQKHPIELYDLRSVARDGIPDSLRGAYWRVLLGYLPLRRENWGDTRSDSQKTYRELMGSLLQMDPETGAPMVSTSEHRIDVDIPRTIPSLHFFACEDTQMVDGVPVTFSPNQQSLRRVLYLYAKCNPGLGYVQGMNEIVGHMLYAFATSHEDAAILEEAGAGHSSTFSPSPSPKRTEDSDDKQRKAALVASSTEGGEPGRNDGEGNDESGEGESKGNSGEEDTVKAEVEEERSAPTDSLTLNSSCRVAGGDGRSELVEADVFYCFQTLTAYVGDTFCRALDGDQTMGVTGAMANFGILVWCCDKELAEHLTKINLQPTFYAFRWITVLLTQEFLLPDVLRIWDFIFSFGNELRPALFFTCAAMLILVRDQLFNMDFSQALPMLQSYPPPDDINALLDLSEQLIASQGLDLLAKIQAGDVKIRTEEDDSEEGDDGDGGENNNGEFSMPTSVKGFMTTLGNRLRSTSKKS